MSRELLEAIVSMQDEMDIDKREVRHQMSSHKKIYITPPTVSDGQSGDTKLVETLGKVYQYTKVNNQWYKIELEKA